MLNHEPEAPAPPRTPELNAAPPTALLPPTSAHRADPPRPCRSWLNTLRPRFGAHWPTKLIVIPVFVTAFFLAYFYLLQNPAFPVTILPVSALDRIIGVQPFAIVPYMALWFYVFLTPAMLLGRRELRVYGAEVIALTAFALGVFYFWPTAVPPMDFTPEENTSWLALLKNVDAAGNACPSLHVAFAVFTLVWLARLLRNAAAPGWVHALNACAGVAIVYSTLATKQHLAVDALAGIALGAAAALYDPQQNTSVFTRAASHFNRQSLALLVSITSKLTLLVLDLEQVSLMMTVIIFLAPDFWILTGLLIPNAASLVPTATCFATTQREVWLTIDDGPDPSTTEPMLDLLERHGARATFFLIGTRAAAYPHLVAEIIRRGHTIGNHTHTHPLAAFWLAGPRRTAREIDTAHATLNAVSGGQATRWFRPPAGIKTFFLRRILADRQMILVGWTARAREHGSKTITAPLNRLKTNLRPGAILLMHESNRHGAQRVALLSALLDHFAATGFRCVLPDRHALRSEGVRTVEGPESPAESKGAISRR
jgi:peptidoglycan/xylan/chitin deacetylase (PgdA/CDA1 family)